MFSHLSTRGKNGIAASREQEFPPGNPERGRIRGSGRIAWIPGFCGQPILSGGERKGNPGGQLPILWRQTSPGNRPGMTRPYPVPDCR